MEKRRVLVLRTEYVFDEKLGKGVYKKVPYYEATFHTWGVNCEEFEAGPGSYTCAVVERDDGIVGLEPANLIQFLDKEATNADKA